jgi:hypothetical protein
VHGIDLKRLGAIAELLTPFFYFFMFVALVAAFCGSAGAAFVVLVLGACVHIAQATLEELRLRG